MNKKSKLRCEQKLYKESNTNGEKKQAQNERNTVPLLVAFVSPVHVCITVLIVIVYGGRLAVAHASLLPSAFHAHTHTHTRTMN